MNNGTGVESTSNRNEYQEYFLGRRGGLCVVLTNLPPSCADCLKIWEPEPPGIEWACPGVCRNYWSFAPSWFTTHKHQINSLPWLAHLINYEHKQVIAHILNSKYLFTKATLSLINILHLTGRGFDISYNKVRAIFCFTTYKYLTANTKHRRTSVWIEDNGTSYALFHNFDDPIATHIRRFKTNVS